jgi:hypothetical protein
VKVWTKVYNLTRIEHRYLNHIFPNLLLLAPALGALVGPAGRPLAPVSAFHTVALAGHDIALHAMVAIGDTGHTSTGACLNLQAALLTLLEEVFVLCDERACEVAHVVLSLGGNDSAGESEGSDDAGELHVCDRMWRCWFV